MQCLDRINAIEIASVSLNINNKEACENENQDKAYHQQAA